MKRKRVACFFTAHYTELNAMKSFVKKINPDVDYIQLCPTGVRKSAKAIRNRKLTSISNNKACKICISSHKERQIS